jgi:hypothetical protein
MNTMLIKILDKYGTRQEEIVAKPRVLISELFESKVELKSIIENQGRKVKMTPFDWPRDWFLYWRKKFISNKSFKKVGEQGNFVFGKDYCLSTDYAFSDNQFGKNKLCKYVDNKQQKEKEVLEEFLGVPIYKAIMKNVGNPREHVPHIDLFALTHPTSNMLIIDTQLYDVNKDIFYEISEKHKTEIVVYNSKDERYRYPYNCLVLQDGFVIANSKTPRFNDLLKELGIEFETVESDYSTKLGGSIRCRTHFAPNYDFVRKRPK